MNFSCEVDGQDFSIFVIDDNEYQLMSVTSSYKTACKTSTPDADVYLGDYSIMIKKNNPNGGLHVTWDKTNKDMWLSLDKEHLTVWFKNGPLNLLPISLTRLKKAIEMAQDEYEDDGLSDAFIDDDIDNDDPEFGYYVRD